MKRMLMLVAVLVAAFSLVACGDSSSREPFDKAIAEGRLSDAQVELVKLKGCSGFYNCCDILIDEYLAIGNLNKAKFVFDKISPHCSMYDIKFPNSCSTARYTERNAKKIYKQLIAADRFEEAWAYHPLSYDSENYPGNAPDYYAYMVDVVTHLCTNGRHDEAYSFINSHIHWFSKNVDNHKWGEDYSQYNKSAMHEQILDVFNSFQ